MQPHYVQRVESRVDAREHRRDDREVLRHVVRDREGGERAAGDQQLLADLDDLDELGRVGVEVDHVAGFLGRRRAAVHRDPDVGLSQRRRVVRAVTGHRDQLPADLFPLDQRHLVFWLRLGQEVVDAGLLGDRAGSERVIARDHDRADAHEPKLVDEAFVEQRVHQRILARRHARPRPDGDAPLRRELLVQGGEGASHVGRGANGAQRIVLVQVRQAEHGHDGVADELLDPPAVPLDHAAHLLPVT